MAVVFVYNVGEDWTVVQGGEAFFVVDYVTVQKLQDGDISTADLAEYGVEWPFWIIDGEPLVYGEELLKAAQQMIDVVGEINNVIPIEHQPSLGDAERMLMDAVGRVTGAYRPAV